VDVRGQNRVQGDRADPREGRRDRIEALRDHAAAQLVGRQDGLAAVPPDAPHLRADRWNAGVAGDVRRHFDDLAHLGVADPGHRIAEIAGVLDEQPLPGVPGLVQVRVRATVGGQLRAGRDPGEAGAHAYLAGAELRGGLIDHLDAARGRDLNCL
jgi:hypothetical protein